MSKIVSISLPYRFNGLSVSEFMNQLFHIDSEGSKLQKHESYLFEFDRLQFIEPSGVVSLYNCMYFLIQNDCRVSLKEPSNQNRLSYLVDTGFFASLASEDGKAKSNRSTMTAIQTILTSEYTSWTKYQLIPWLQRQTGINSLSFADLESAISEVFNNVGDHAKCNGVAAGFAQYYPNLRKTIIVIGDMGIGILQSVKKYDSNIGSYMKAMEWASVMNNTSKSTPQNQGVGLAHIQHAVDSLNGVLEIVSGDAKLRYFAGEKTITKEQYSYPGTFIEITLFNDMIPVIDEEEEDFEW